MDPSMYNAATSGDVGFLQRIKDGEVSPDVLSQKTPQGNNILHLAAEFKQISFFKEYEPSFYQRFPLLWDKNKMGDTPLHIAARVGCAELLDFLIDCAKKLHIQRAAGDQERGPTYAKSYKKLLRKTNMESHTALHVAALYGHLEAVNSLIKADPKLCFSTNSTMESPLFLATCKGFSNVARDILNKSSVSPSFQGINGVTALHAAVTHTYQGAEEIVKIMVSKYPHTIKEADALGWTPLHYAAFRGNLEAIKSLMNSDKSSTCYMLDNWGMSALHIAAYKGHIKVMEELMRCRPDTCECRNSKDQTILHVAVLGAQSHVVKYILDQTDQLTRLIDQEDIEGNTPLHLAVIHQNQEIKTMLMSRGCRSVDNTGIDKGFSLVFDNFLGEDIKIQTASALGNRENEDPNLPPYNKAEQEGSSVILGNGSDKLEITLQGRSFGVTLFHEQIRRDFKKFELHPDNKDSSASAVADNQQKNVKPGFNLLIAILIATVTFTAALAPPGGYGDDGKVILSDNTYFKLFDTFNTISFLLSLYIIAYEYVRVYFPSSIDGFIILKPGSHILVSLLAMFCALLSGGAAGSKISGDHWKVAVYLAFWFLAVGQNIKLIVKSWNESRKKRSGSGTA